MKQFKRIITCAALAAGASFAQEKMSVASFAWGERTVAGKPYAAENTTESVQTLADGNRIVRKNTTKIFRDGQGRTRREQTIEMFGAQAPPKPVEWVTIQDPVAQATYTLDQDKRVARKLAPPNMTINYETKADHAGEAASREMLERKAATIKKAAEAATLEYQAARRVESAVAVGGTVAVSGPIEIRGTTNTVRERLRQPGPDMMTFERVAAPGVAGAPADVVFVRSDSGSMAPEVEKLGVRTIEGVECTGTRRTTRIPAGKIGNEREMVIVTEEWFSPRLDTIVLAKTTDPRFGETTHRLTRISLDEPAAHLFQVPAGYTVEEKPMTMGRPVMLKDE